MSENKQRNLRVRTLAGAVSCHHVATWQRDEKKEQCCQGTLSAGCSAGSSSFWGQYFAWAWFSPIPQQKSSSVLWQNSLTV